MRRPVLAPHAGRTGLAYQAALAQAEELLEKIGANTTALDAALADNAKAIAEAEAAEAKFWGPHQAAQIEAAIPSITGLPLLKTALSLTTKGSLSAAEQEVFLVDSTTLREMNPGFYANMVVVAQSIVGYEREMQRLERRARELEGEDEALGAVRPFEKWKGAEEGKRVVEDVVLENRVGELVDLKKWPLPPKRSGWIVVQGERKRNTQVN